MLTWQRAEHKWVVLQVLQLGDAGFDTSFLATGPQQLGRGGTPTLSHAKNGANGVVWTTGTGYGLRAYDAAATGSLVPIYTDKPSDLIKFQTVVVANGLAFLAGNGCVLVYGRLG